MANMMLDDRWLLPQGANATFNGSRLVGARDQFILNDMQHLNGVAGLNEAQLAERGIVKMQDKPDETFAVATPDFDNPGQWTLVPKSPAEIQAIFQREIETFIENTAKARGYSSAVSCASYVTDPNPTWAEEAANFIQWRSDVWTYVFTELAKVQNGERPIPGLTEFIAELPAAPWG